MRTRRCGGVFWAGAGLTAGVLAGARVDSVSTAGGLPSLAVAAAALAGAALLLVPPGPLRRRSRTGSPAARGRTGDVLALVSVCLACGAALGARSAERGRAACTAGLPRGVELRAVGLLERTAEAPGDGETATARLSAVSVRSAGRRCRLPALRVRTDAPRLPPAGSRVSVRGTWRPYPSAGELRRPEHRGSLRAEEVAPAAAAGATGALPGVPAARWRERAARRLDGRLPPDAAALARALTLADRGGLPEALTRRFARAGLAHLLAISGLHVGVLAAAAVWLFGLWLPAGPRHVAAAGLTGAYVLWIGAPPSAVRASLLFAGWSLSRLRGSPVRTSDLLAAAAAAALLADPLTALDPGFQLSFAGFSGVVLGAATAGRWTERRGPGRRARGLLLTAAGAGACALTAPLTALHFQRAAPVAVASGLVGTPLVGLALFSSLAVLVLPGWMAAPAEGAATGLLRLLTRAVDAFASVPGGHVTSAPPGAGYWIAALLLLLAWVRYVQGGRPGRSLTPAAAAALVALAWPSVASVGAHLRTGGATLLCTLDVGQGDAAAIRTRSGRWLLLDAGPAPPPGRPGSDEGLATVVPFLTERGAQELELLAFSHADLDHVGGAGAVLDRLRVRRVASAGAASPGEPHLEFLRAVVEEGARWLTLRPGDRMLVGEVEILVLDAGGGRVGRPRPGGRADANDTGVSLRLTVDGGFTWVTTGDASMGREMAMLGRWPADSLRAHLVSVGHHGSRTSTAPAWLEAVSPEVAVISAGAGNWFGHPHPLTLATLEEAGAQIRRTDRHGTVCVRVTPGGGWRLEE